MWLAFKLLASGALEAVLRWLSAAGKWLISDWRHGPLVWFAALFLVNSFFTIPALHRRIAGLETDLAAEQSAHLGTVNAFLAASAEAQRDAEANVARVAREQEIITDEVTRDLRSDLAAVTARFGRLRIETAAARDPGNADPAGLPAPGAAPGRAAGSAPDQNLPAGDLTAQRAWAMCSTPGTSKRCRT